MLRTNFVVANYNNAQVFYILHMIILKSPQPDPVCQRVHTRHCRGAELPIGALPVGLWSFWCVLLMNGLMMIMYKKVKIIGKTNVYFLE